MANYLITGASGGMGSAVCRLLAEKGHRVWGIDRAVPVDAHKGWAFIEADVTSSDALQAAFHRVKADAGTLDGVIHTAGVYDLNSLVEMSEEDFLRDFNVNLFGMFRVNKLFLPLLKKGARIVIISSELAPLNPLPFTRIYAITKAAVEKYAASLRMEVQLLGHKVVVIRPGAVQTNMLPASTEKLDRFCAETKLYQCNASRFKNIVDRVETRNIPADRIAEVVYGGLTAKHPRLLYNINRNPLLLLLNALPSRLQLWIIRSILR
ncbi:MAG: SDR family NAD(P)-dependent oxidoreductase [Clostridia bacterium]|nr:SDR family NAD(P)-dependent oxidoreductase [Clostridia bacterium]